MLMLLEVVRLELLPFFLSRSACLGLVPMADATPDSSLPAAARRVVR